MNAHDSERIKGMLEELGLGEAATQDDADVLVFNTCTIREKPDQKFAAHLAQAAAVKRRDPDKVIAVGGCYAEAQRDRLFQLYPYVDVAFGPGSIPHLGEWLGAGGLGVARGRFGLDERSFAGELPMHRERGFQAWVQISMGCNSTCAYCIVPAVRGREVSRRPGDILAEVTRLSVEGVREVTLLGQNVNSWGRDLAPDIHTEFGELLRACDAVDGIERLRFTSPHPKDFRRPVIDAMAECAAVCEHAHLPLQSGSSRILKAMRRTYNRERYLRLAAELREAIPDLALTTDLIVGFPGETEADFVETMSAVEEVGFDSAFTFVYSPRAGTEAAAMSEQVSGGCETRSHREAGRGRPAGRRLPQRGASWAGGGGPRRESQPHRPEPAAWAHPAQHHRQLLGQRCARRSGRRADRGGDVHDPARRPGRSGRRLMRILVTGSSGQIGTNLAQRLQREGHDVFGVDKRLNTWTDDFRYLLQDLSGHYPSFPDGIGGVEYPEVDLVVHLAAHAKVHQLVRQPHRALENAVMTFNVLEFCRQQNLPIVFSSSREVYGDVHRFAEEEASEASADFAYTESTYSASKIAGEAFVYSYARCYGLRYLVFRFSNVYGRYDNDLARMVRVLPLFIHTMLRDEPVTVFGQEKTLDFTYVDDCIDGITRGIEALAEGRVVNETINLAYGHGNSLVHAAELIARRAQGRAEDRARSVAPRRGHALRRRPDEGT